MYSITACLRKQSGTESPLMTSGTRPFPPFVVGQMESSVSDATSESRGMADGPLPPATWARIELPLSLEVFFSVDLFFVCLFLMAPSWGKLKQAHLLVQKQLQPGYKAPKLILVKFTGVFVIQYVIPMSIVPHKEGKRQHFWVPKSLINHYISRATDQSGLQDEQEQPQTGRSQVDKSKTINTPVPSYSHTSHNQELGSFLACSIIVNRPRLQAFQSNQSD